MKFYSETKLDPLAFSVMGLSAKENDNAIGFFGTGFKYAIAIILRNGGSVRIESEGEKWEFDTVPVSFRGQETKQVVCNNKELGYTTDYGKLWSVADAFRELYCNAKDENGGVTLGDVKAKTVVYVDCDEMRDVYEKEFRERYIQDDETPIWENEEYAVYRGHAQHVFYQGVAALKAPCPTFFRWNIKRKMELSEDRKLDSWAALMRLGEALTQVDKKEIFDAIGENSGEAAFRFSCFSSFRGEATKEFNAFAQKLYDNGIEFGDGNIFEFARKLGASIKTVELTMSKREKLKVKRVVKFLAKLGYDVSDYEIEKVDSTKLLGRADEGKIQISEQALDRGCADLAVTILEEYAHLKHGFRDHSRQFQDWMLAQIIKMGEELTEEIL